MKKNIIQITLKLMLIFWLLTYFNPVACQDLSIHETVKYINDVFSKSKCESYRYEISYNESGQLELKRYKLYEWEQNKVDKIIVAFNDLSYNIYISEDMESCSGSVLKNLGGKHIKIWCIDKSDCIYDPQSSPKYTCNVSLYLDVSNYDYQRTINALKHLVSLGKEYSQTNKQTNDPFAPKTKKQISSDRKYNFNKQKPCDVKTNYRTNGIIVKYINPEYVGKGNKCELGLSVQTNGKDYFFSTSVRYFDIAKKISGDLFIQLSDNESLNLVLYRSELATVNNEKVSLSIFKLNKYDIERLRKHKILRVVFQEYNGVYQIVAISENNDVIMNQLNCLMN